jgi:serine/threonine protein kinase
MVQLAAEAAATDPHAGATERPLLADRFDELWRTRETAPDVFAFLAAHRAVPARERIDVLLVDQAHRWRTGDPIPAERYLQEFPEIARDPGLKLDLVYGEFSLAQLWCGDRPDGEWTLARFPELRAALIGQAEVNDRSARAAVSEPASSADGGPGAPGDSSRGPATADPEVGASPPAPPLSPGLILGDYQLQERIGRGGMGAVYRALHLRLGRAVALKVIAPPLLSSEQAMARFYREMRAVGQLDHPHLVRATDARHIGDWHLLIMELLDGMDLGRLMARIGLLSIADACEMIRQTAEGLEHLHERGIVHRDIKPSNLMLIRGGTIKVLDLGVARLQEEMADGITPSHLVTGTPDYMAPEQAEDPRAVTPRSDAYSLGCTLYHLLAGQPPYHDSASPFGKLLGHRQAPIPPLRPRRPELSEGLAGVLDRMLAKDPATRPGSAREVAEGLRPWCLGADLPALLDRALRASDPPEPSAGVMSVRTKTMPSLVASPRGDQGPSTTPDRLREARASGVDVEPC